MENTLYTQTLCEKYTIEIEKGTSTDEETDKKYDVLDIVINEHTTKEESQIKFRCLNFQISVEAARYLKYHLEAFLEGQK